MACGEQLKTSHHDVWLFAFTSLSERQDLNSLVIVIQFVRGVGVKEQQFTGNSNGKHARL